MKRFVVFAILLLASLIYAQDDEFLEDKFFGAHYPHLYDNPILTPEMRDRIAPHLLPLRHKMKPVLDAIFSTSRAIENEDSLAAAGFITLHSKQSSFVKVLKHPEVPGYLFKIYMDTETRLKQDKPGWEWLTQRCEGAKRIRDFIKNKKIKHFSVPDKWLYLLPIDPPTKGPIHQPVVLLVTDMNLVSKPEILEAWKTVPTREYLDELYYILSHGCGSRFLSSNIPYTKSGKFAFIDTEYPDRKITLWKVKEFLSDEMQLYWDELCK